MIGFHPLRNVIEDGALNDFNALRFRTMAEDTLESYPRPGPNEELGFIETPECQAIMALLQRPPLYAQALAGLLVDWSELRHEYGFLPSERTLLSTPRVGPSVRDERLLDFFDSALVPTRLCISLIPPHDDLNREVRMAFSEQRFKMMEHQVYPHLKKLVEYDIQDLMQAIKQDGGTSEQSSPPDEARRKAEQMIASLDDALRELLGSLADKATNEVGSAQQVVAEQHRKERDAEEEARIQEEAARRSRENTEKILNALSPFAQEYHRISHLIEPAYNRLSELFDPKTRFSWNTGLPSGTHFNPIGMLRFEATGEGFETMHMRRNRPCQPDLFTGVLFDRSFSMSKDSRFIHARRALILLRILYERLELPTMVTWFADKVGTILTPEDSLSDSTFQKRLMRRTVYRDEGNKDGKGLRYLDRRMLEYPSGQRAIIVLTDAGVLDAGGLKKKVEELAKVNTPVLHFGLGENTSDRSGCYRYSWGDLDVLDDGPDGFMATFCKVITNLASGAFEKSIDGNGDISWLQPK
jgi:hypothetical protein